MTIFTFDELPGEEVLLEPRRTMGPGLQPVRLSVGGPFPVPLDDGSVDADDHELRKFINHEAATHAYWLVRLACTFQAESDEPFIGHGCTSSWRGTTARRNLSRWPGR